MISTNSNTFEALDVVKNLDFLLRSKNLQTVLVASDFPREPLLATTIELARSLMNIYQRKILILDFNESHTSTESFYQNVKNLDEVSDQNSLNIYISECSKHYDQILVLPHIKLNVEDTVLPTMEFDGSILIRSKKSITTTNRKVLTNKIQDSQVAISAIIDAGL